MAERTRVDHQDDQEREGQYYRGVAAVPPARNRLRWAGDDTDAGYGYGYGYGADGADPEAPAGAAAGQAAGRRGAPGPAPGLVVGQRGRRLRSGSGWTWAGLVFVVSCWAVWMLAVRGTDVVGPVIGLGLVLAVGLWLFVVARLLGRTVLERLLDRDRPSAWPSHLTVFVFLALAGLTFLQQTPWIQETWRWLTDLWTAAGDGVGWLGDRWSE